MKEKMILILFTLALAGITHAQSDISVRTDVVFDAQTGTYVKVINTKPSDEAVYTDNNSSAPQRVIEREVIYLDRNDNLREQEARDTRRFVRTAATAAIFGTVANVILNHRFNRYSYYHHHNSSGRYRRCYHTSRR